MAKGFIITITQRVLVRDVDNSGDAYDAWINAGRSEADMSVEILREDYEDYGTWDGDENPEYRGSNYGNE